MQDRDFEIQGWEMLSMSLLHRPTIQLEMISDKLFIKPRYSGSG